MAGISAEAVRRAGAAVALASVLAARGQDDDLRAARTMGSPSAPVTLYEMSDFQCPYCAQFARETLPAIERDYVATGKVRLVFVNFPLPMHANAEPAAEFAMCAARQGRFWQVHDLLFRHQAEWENLRDPAIYLLGLGDSAGVDREELVRCLRTHATRAIVESDARGSVRSGATGTPTFYVEGGLMRGNVPLVAFRQVLDSIVRAKVRGPG